MQVLSPYQALKTIIATPHSRRDLELVEETLVWSITSFSTILQSITTGPESGRNRTISQNNMKEEVEVVAPIVSQLHSLIDTPSVKIRRQPTNLMTQTLTYPSPVFDQASSSRERTKSPYSTCQRHHHLANDVWEIKPKENKNETCRVPTLLAADETARQGR